MKTSSTVWWCVSSIMLFSSLLSQAQQQKEHNNAFYLSLGSYMISQDKTEPLCALCPTIDVIYNRFLDDGFVVGAGYYFRNINHIKYEFDNHEIHCKKEDHALMASLGYMVKFYAFNITPYIATGLEFSRYKSNPQLINEYNFHQTKFDTSLIINPGVRLGYEITRWMIFASYNFDCTPQFNHLYHNFNVGLGFLF